MTPKEILNADMSTIGEWLRAGFDWWIDELALLMPARLRRLAHRAPPVLAIWRTDGTIHLSRNGQSLKAPSPDRPVRARILIPAESVLIRELDLPRMSLRALRKVVALDLDRLMPFPPGAAGFDLRPTAQPAEAGRQRLRLCAMPMVSARRALADVRAAGVEPTSLGVEDAETANPFDLLPAVCEADGGDPGRRARWFWWLTTAAFAGVNLVVFLLLDQMELTRLRDAVAEQQPLLTATMTMKRRWIATDTARRELVARRGDADPLALVNAVTVALPATAWVRHLDWAPPHVKLSGYRSPGVDIAAPLRAAPGFSDIRLSNDTQPSAAGIQAFDVSATYRAAQARP